MNNDLISRSALFNSLSNVKTLEEAFAVIQNAPDSRWWISCEKVLPEGNGKIYAGYLEESETVLVYGSYDGEFNYGLGRYVRDLEDGVSGWNGLLFGDWDLGSCNVLAWMPLPEPWKGEE